MNVLEAIEARRAVRSYLPTVVDDAKIGSVLRAAVHAPSAMNEQLWIFSIVQSTEQLARWSTRAKSILLDGAADDPKTQHYGPLLTDPKFNIFYDASTLVVIGTTERRTYTDADCWLAAQNLMLAACEAGLASCPIGFAIPLLNSPEIKAELSFPPAAVVVAPIILGYARNVPPPVPRAEPRILCWSR
jgi:nitroreductase